MVYVRVSTGVNEMVWSMGIAYVVINRLLVPAVGNIADGTMLKSSC